MTKRIMTRIGRTTLGRPLELDILMEKSGVEYVLSRYNLDEQIDMLCVLEYILYDRLLSDAPPKIDEVCLNMTFEYLNEKRHQQSFSDRLDQRGLRTSIDRVRHGKARAL